MSFIILQYQNCALIPKLHFEKLTRYSLISKVSHPELPTSN